jgi:hypothetical protein
MTVKEFPQKKKGKPSESLPLITGDTNSEAGQALDH